jgi:hypothetical protein
MDCVLVERHIAPHAFSRMKFMDFLWLNTSEAK